MNTYLIEYTEKSFEEEAPKKAVKEYLNRICEKLGLKNVEFSVTFCDEDYIRTLNRDYRNMDNSTDILSFAAEDDASDVPFIVSSRAKRNLGDMIICLSVMHSNARSFNVSSTEELSRLLIHGTLHLSGLDHKTNDMETEIMLIKQEKLLNEIGLVF